MLPVKGPDYALALCEPVGRVCPRGDMDLSNRDRAEVLEYCIRIHTYDGPESQPYHI